MEDASRLFLALWPDAQLRDALAEHQAAWQWPPSAARVAHDKLHVTLHFLGEVERVRVGPLKEALQCVRFQAFELAFTAATVWQGGIAVLGTTLPEPLAALHAQLGQVLQQLGLRLERRPYKPHVTLARRAAGAEPAAAMPAVAWTVRSFALVESLQGRYLVRSMHAC